MTTIDAQTSIWTIRAMMFMAGAANSMVFLTLQTSMFTGIARADTGDASAIFNTNRQTSVALGVAILSSVVAGVGGQSFAAFHAGYVAAALIALTGSVTAYALIHDGDARATMVRREDLPVGGPAPDCVPAAADRIGGTDGNADPGGWRQPGARGGQGGARITTRSLPRCASVSAASGKNSGATLWLSATAWHHAPPSRPLIMPGGTSMEVPACP